MTISNVNETEEWNILKLMATRIASDCRNEDYKHEHIGLKNQNQLTLEGKNDYLGDTSACVIIFILVKEISFVMSPSHEKEDKKFTSKIQTWL